VIRVEALGLGFNNSDYPGAFTSPVKRVIEDLIDSPCLHLFSGSSLIGDERVDIEHPNSTLRMDVKEFIATDKRDWLWAVLDPPYQITRTNQKLNGYGLTGCVASDVQFRRRLKLYFQTHAENVLWLDICAPMIKGFKREKLWLFLPGGFHTVRVLSWLKRISKPMEF
jgi:hypothetical protein